MTKQPKWQFVANLGDASPVEHGGYFVFRDETGVYSPEAEYWNPEERRAYRVTLDRMKLVNGHLIPYSIYAKHTLDSSSLPYSLASYIEWFSNDLSSVASFVGVELFVLQSMFQSDDPRKLAEAYRAIYDFHGWENGDSYPLRLSEAEAEKRYKNWK